MRDIMGGVGANCELHPLIHTRLEFDLAQNAVGGQVNAVEKVTPISLGSQIRLMGVVKNFCDQGGQWSLPANPMPKKEKPPLTSLMKGQCGG
jgi:hypothetical protein